jgi:mono/diheme cytochrome c family protein
MRPVPTQIMSPRAIVVAALSLLAGLPAASAAPRAPDLARGFKETVRPFVETYCLGCHGEQNKGDLDLRPYDSSAAAVKDLRHWTDVQERLNAQEMPPPKA